MVHPFLMRYDAIDYSKNPQYFNFKLINGYDRKTTFNGRGDNGFITVLQGKFP
jgi:hypothetical protein